MSPRVLYLVTRFPAVTETFVVNEWLVLAERFSMGLVALRRSGEAPVHPETARVLPRVRFARAGLAAQLAWVARRPRTYLSTLAEVLRGALRYSVAEAAQEALVFLRAAAVARTAQRDGVAHVHAHFASHPATAAWVIHRLAGIPFSFTAHANDLFVAPVLLERKAADARFVVAISDYNRALLLERCPDARVETIHCGVDGERHAWRGLRGRTPDRVVCVASLSEKKGQADLLDAVALLAARRPGVALELIGDGPERERLARRARERGVSERVAHARRPLDRRGGGGAGCGPRLRAPVDPAAERPDGGHPRRSDGGDGRRRAGRRDAAVGHSGARRGRRHGAARRAARPRRARGRAGAPARRRRAGRRARRGGARARGAVASTCAPRPARWAT